MRPPVGPLSAAQHRPRHLRQTARRRAGIERNRSSGKPPETENPPGARSARLGSAARLRGRALAHAQLEVGSRQARKPSSFSLVFHTFCTDFWAQLMGIPLRGGRSRLNRRRDRPTSKELAHEHEPQRPSVGIFTGRLLRDAYGRNSLLTCGVVAGGSALGRPKSTTDVCRGPFVVNG